MAPTSPRNHRHGDEPAERWPARLVGARLREARRLRGLTLDDVASVAGFKEID